MRARYLDSISSYIAKSFNDGVVLLTKNSLFLLLVVVVVKNRLLLLCFFLVLVIYSRLVLDSREKGWISIRVVGRLID